MRDFKHNKIFLDSETVAEQLRSARQAKKLKLDSISGKLNINIKYLEALEKGNFEKLPTGVYGKNFLREYSIFLGLNYKEIEKIFQKELDVIKKSPAKELFSRQVARAQYFLATPKIIKNIIILIVVLACFAYLGFAIKKFTSPPALVVENPNKNLVITEKTINVIGETEAESQVMINGNYVLSDTEGNFTKKINLKKGINIITITSKKKYGRENTIIRQILVKEEE